MTDEEYVPLSERPWKIELVQARINGAGGNIEIHMRPRKFLNDTSNVSLPSVPEDVIKALRYWLDGNL